MEVLSRKTQHLLARNLQNHAYFNYQILAPFGIDTIRLSDIRLLVSSISSGFVLSGTIPIVSVDRRLSD